jgi:AraC family transcriptional regulator
MDLAAPPVAGRAQGDCGNGDQNQHQWKARWGGPFAEGLVFLTRRIDEGGEVARTHDGRQVMRQQEPGLSGLHGPLELIKHFPGEPFAASAQREWVGLEAIRYRYQPPNEAFQPPLTHHTLLLFLHTPKELELQTEGISRVVPPRPGSILVVPAGSPARWRWSSHSDSLHVFLEPGLVAQVAAEAFEIDPARASIPPLDGLDQPQLRNAMLAVNDELTADAAGSQLVGESLANLLAVHLIRNASTPRLPTRRTVGALAQGRLRAVVEYVEEHLDAGLTLEQLAAAAHLSVYHFARQFKAATGLPPHQYVILRRVERARHLLQAATDLSLAEVAACAGFSDQSQLTQHFKRLVGVTPGQFRRPARIA